MRGGGRRHSAGDNGAGPARGCRSAAARRVLGRAPRAAAPGVAGLAPHPAPDAVPAGRGGHRDVQVDRCRAEASPGRGEAAGRFARHGAQRAGAKPGRRRAAGPRAVPGRSQRTLLVHAAVAGPRSAERARTAPGPGPRGPRPAGRGGAPGPRRAAGGRARTGLAPGAGRAGGARQAATAGEGRRGAPAQAGGEAPRRPLPRAAVRTRPPGTAGHRHRAAEPAGVGGAERHAGPVVGGRPGARVRRRPDRQAVRVGRGGPRVLRLLGAHLTGVGARGPLDPPHQPGAVGRTAARPAELAAPRGPGDLLPQGHPCRDVPGRRPGRAGPPPRHPGQGLPHRREPPPGRGPPGPGGGPAVLVPPPEAPGGRRGGGGHGVLGRVRAQGDYAPATSAR